MIRLELVDEVYETLKRKQPSLTNQIPEMMAKYIANLEDELNTAIARGRSVEGWLFDAYDISLTNVGNGGGRVWRKGNVRVHKWLVDNGIILFKKLEQLRQANNFTKEISLISFTKLVRVIDQENLSALRELTPTALNHFLENVPVADQDKYKPMLQQIYALPQAARQKKYHETPIDIQSLQGYIRKLLANTVSDLSTNQAETNNRCAIKILRIAQLNDGVLPQKVNSSEFGRTYYEGHSVQSVHKSLRAAMLGDSYEYDVKSSVISWKMSFAKDLMNSEDLTGDPDLEFPGISYYLKDKQAFMDEVIDDVFRADCPWTMKKKEEKIKEAVTALSFGAKLVEAKWVDQNGVEQETSIMGILSDVNERERFLNQQYITAFKQDQTRLDSFIVMRMKSKYPHLSKIERLQTKRGTSSSRLLSWLYQHAETEVMDFVREKITQAGKDVIANVHDAIVVRQKLTSEELQKIIKEARLKFQIEFFALGEKRYQRC